MFLMLLRPIFCEKLKIAPPIGKQPPSNVWICEIGRKISLNFGEDLFFFSFFGDYLILGGKNPWISAGLRISEITLKFGEDLFFFFLEITLFWEENTYDFPRFPRHFVSIFGQTVWNWFKINEISSQGRLHTSHFFKIAPPLFQILATRLVVLW